MATRVAILALVLLATACGKEAPPGVSPDVSSGGEARAPAPREYLPRLTNALLPPPLAGIVPGRSTEEDLRARFPDLETDKDKSLGGGSTVGYNDHPAVVMRLPRRDKADSPAREDGVEDLQFYLVPDADGVPRVSSMRLVQDPRGAGTLCAWLHEGIGSDPESLACAGTNKSLGRGGKSADAGVYCIGTPDGKRGILVECRTTSKGLGEIEYDLLDRR